MKIPYFNKEASLNRAILRLKDAVWFRDQYMGYPLTPSEVDSQLRKIHRRAVTVDRLGGDSSRMLPDDVKKALKEHPFV